MNKLVLKTALITIAILAVAALAVFGGWILCSPQTMATACERTGNYSFAVTCADLHYKYTKKPSALARCVEDSILADDDVLIVKYGDRLISDGEFNSVCAAKDALLSETDYGKYTLSYKLYVCGNLAAAHYRTDGDTAKAIEIASSGGIKAFNKLAIEIAVNGDEQSAGLVIKTLNASGQPEEVARLIELLESIHS